MENNKKLSVLELLEQEFEQTKEAEKKEKAPDQRNKTGGSRIRHKKQIMLALLLCLVIAGVTGLTKNFAKKNRIIEREIPEFLTAEEKEDWKSKEIDEDQIFIYVNTNLVLEKEKHTAQLRLANPPFCVYPLEILISQADGEGTVFYRSEMLQPGESIAEAELSDVPEMAGTYDVNIAYTYYDAEGEHVVGEHQVGAVLKIKE